ncbi:MAG: hypothetical protein ABJA82_19140 [Myxococcales bacterium]
MNFLSSLNPLSILSNTVESVCDAVLPKQLEFVGDAVGLITDLETGNYVKCLDDAQDLLKDLPQQLGELTKNIGGAAGAGVAGDLASTVSRGLEPTPPTHYRAPTPRDDGAARGDSPKPLGAPVMRGAPPKGKATKIDNNETVARPSNPPRPDKTSEATKASNAAAAAEAAPEVSSADNAKTKVSEGTKAASTQASKSMEPDAFFKLSDKALMDAVRDGKLPDSVKNDPEQMRRLQVRMQDIAQMNQLITTMLNTMHEMNKAVIQNLRV